MYSIENSGAAQACYDVAMKKWFLWLVVPVGLGCGPRPSPPTVDLAVLDLRVRARAGDIEVLKERAKADSRHNPTRMAIDLDGLQEHLMVLRRQLDLLKAAGPTPDPQTILDFENAHETLVIALREFRARYKDPLAPGTGT